MTDFSSPPDPRAGAAAAFRDAFDTALTSIEPFAVLSEARPYQPSVVETFLDPIKAARNEADRAMLISPPDEAADFAGLATALDEFATAFSRITMPPGVEKNAERVRTTTDALAQIARSHSSHSDRSEPSVDKRAAKDFYHAVNAWEDATADLARKLGL